MNYDASEATCIGLGIEYTTDGLPQRRAVILGDANGKVVAYMYIESFARMLANLAVAAEQTEAEFRSASVKH